MKTRAPRRMLFVNFGGLGNGVYLLPLLKRFEDVSEGCSYFSTDNPIFRSQLPSRVGLRGLLDVVPAAWRRFACADWPAIDRFLDEQAIDLVVNLRNQGPLRDVGYFQFKQHATAKNLEFWELDHAELCARSAPRLLIHDLVELFARHGIDLSDFDRHWLRRLVGPPRRSRQPTLGFFTGSAQRVKCLPAQVWIALADNFSTGTAYRIVVYAGREPWERALAAEVVARTSMAPDRCVLVSGLTTEEWCASMGDCDGLVSNDTSAVHIAAALGVPIVGVYSATDPLIWGGLSGSFVAVESRVGATCPSRRPETGNCDFYYSGCPGPCTEDIVPEQIRKAIERLLSPAAFGEAEPLVGSREAVL